MNKLVKAIIFKIFKVKILYSHITFGAFCDFSNYRKSPVTEAPIVLTRKSIFNT